MIIKTLQYVEYALITVALFGFYWITPVLLGVSGDAPRWFYFMVSLFFSLLLGVKLLYNNVYVARHCRQCYMGNADIYNGFLYVLIGAVTFFYFGAAIDSVLDVKVVRLYSIPAPILSMASFIPSILVYHAGKRLGLLEYIAKKYTIHMRKKLLGLIASLDRDVYREHISDRLWNPIQSCIPHIDSDECFLSQMLKWYKILYTFRKAVDRYSVLQSWKGLDDKNTYKHLVNMDIVGIDPASIELLQAMSKDHSHCLERASDALDEAKQSLTKLLPNLSP